MTAVGVLQVVIRPRQIRRLVAGKQARPVAPGHLHELLQTRPHRGLVRRRHRPVNGASSCTSRRRTFFAGSPSSSESGRSRSPIGTTRALPGTARPSPPAAPQQLPQPFQTPGQVARLGDDIVQACGKSGSIDPAASARRPKSRGSPSSVKAPRMPRCSSPAPPPPPRPPRRPPAPSPPVLDLPDAPHPLLQLLLGVAIRLVDRLGRLA